MPLQKKQIIKELIKQHPQEKRYIKLIIKSLLQTKKEGLTIKEILNELRIEGYQATYDTIRRHLWELYKENKINKFTDKKTKQTYYFRI
ncbi:MAG: hypothetical protein AB1467_06700 [Candidatus Diapherotrites archaeon]